MWGIGGERQRTHRPKIAASLRVAAKMAAGFVERLDRIPDTLFAFLLPGRPFSLATRLTR
jgi:hypothetical protein